VLRAGDRARDLVRQILTFSRQKEQGSKPLRISLIVKEALKLLRASLPKTIEIRQKIKSDSGTILADPSQIHQILMNLCTNAAHAMREKGGVLEISLMDEYLDSEAATLIHDLRPGPYLRLTVSDTGHGMDKVVVERIFEPYFSTKGKDEGTGLGLSMVHGIVTSYGGTVTVDSEPGKGSSFELYFPRIESGVLSEIQPAGPLPGGTERILFIDDEKVVVDTAQQMLAQLGYKVVTKTNGIEALEIFREDPDRFDMIITDMTMPKMTGDELGRELLLIRPDVPIILCTGFSEKIDEERAKEIGIREFVLKPIVMSEIAQIIRKVLDQE
jgi:CheY-like chemotaxis protein/anti-sigma regulatory factor (Ser/Thr protein kinase)